MAGDRRAAAAHRGDPRLPVIIVVQQAPAHLHGADQRLGQALPEGARARCCRCTRAASRSTSRTRARTTSSAAARSRTSPGRACSTSRPAPSAAAARASARRGTPTSRCRPKLVIMDLRDHLLAKAPYVIAARTCPRRAPSRFDGGADQAGGHGADVPESGFGRVPGSGPEQAARPLVGTAGAGRGHRPRRAVVVHHLRRVRRAVPGRHRARRPHRRHAPPPGADRDGVPVRARRAVQEPREQGQPLGAERLRAPRLDQEARLRGAGRSTASCPADTEYLFWVGCAGAFDDGQRKTIQAIAELLHRAGVGYVVLGPEETCTGDPARRSGNEFLFQMLAQQNVEVLNTVFEARAGHGRSSPPARTA